MTRKHISSGSTFEHEIGYSRRNGVVGMGSDTITLRSFRASSSTVGSDTFMICECNELFNVDGRHRGMIHHDVQYQRHHRREVAQGAVAELRIRAGTDRQRALP